MSITKKARSVAATREVDPDYIPDFKEVGLNGKFANLALKRFKLSQEKKVIEEDIKEINSRIEGEISGLGVDGLKSVRVDDLRITVVNGSSSTISAERLLELGVPADKILKATKRTEYVTVQVTQTRE